MRHDPDVQRVVHSFQLGLPRSPVVGRTGELLGRGAGSSLEFHEYRPYQPGDDIRHLDWAAYARSDTLMVRLFREEISPRTEILLDASRSMTSGAGVKSLVARQLAAALTLLCAHIGGKPSLIVVNDARPMPILGVDTLDQLTERTFDASIPFAAALDENLIPLKRQAVRIVISDFLFPHDPDALIRKLAGDASTLWAIQLLGEWESSPSPLGGRRLIDLESTRQSDLMIDRRTIAAYVERLRRLQESLARACRRSHAAWASVVAERGLLPVCRDDLCAAGMLQPA